MSESEKKPTTSFVDSNGETWSLKLNVLVVERINETTGEDMFDLEDTGELAKKLCLDDVFVCKVAHAICIPQIKERNKTDDDFAEAIADGDAIERASLALEAAVINFTRSPRRATVAGVLSKARMAFEKAAKVAERKLADGGEFDQVVDKIIKKADETFVTSAQESAGLNPGDSP